METRGEQAGGEQAQQDKIEPQERAANSPQASLLGQASSQMAPGVVQRKVARRLQRRTATGGPALASAQGRDKKAEREIQSEIADEGGLGALRGFISFMEDKAEAATGVRPDAGKFAQGSLDFKGLKIPQLAGAQLNVHCEGLFTESATGVKELSTTLKIGFSWGIDWKIIKFNVNVNAIANVKVKGKDMVQGLIDAAKGALMEGMKIFPVLSLLGPVVGPAASKVLGGSPSLYDVILWFCLKSRWSDNEDVQHFYYKHFWPFFGKHASSYDMSVGIGVGASSGRGGIEGQALHGIEGDAGTTIRNQESYNELAAEAFVNWSSGSVKMRWAHRSGTGGGTTRLNFGLKLTGRDMSGGKKEAIDGVGKLAKAFQPALSPSKKKFDLTGFGGQFRQAFANAPKSTSAKKYVELQVEIIRQDNPKQAHFSWDGTSWDAKLLGGVEAGFKAELAGAGASIEAAVGGGGYIDVSGEIKNKLKGAPAAPSAVA